ncbi:MAG: GntR family transcriptional regulator [Peptoniphilaceae bacterium]|nr:GntR family transcriptional regulator [Peptoniphilaceae bacterium]MDY6019018.1 GntR family transcriptional regulator [Anaerococcus sp.]
MSLYLQLVDQLTKEISTMKPGDRIPPERQLCEDYKVSRTTVRNAIDKLCQQSLLTRIQGKGTFVSKANVNKEDLSNYYSFTKQTQKIGKVPKSIILDFHIEKANKEIAESLAINFEDLVIKMTRLRKADDDPMMFEITYIPYENFQNISKELLSKKALYDIFEQDCNSKIFKVNEKFSVDRINSRQAKYLNEKKDSPCLKIVRKSYDLNGTVIEYTISYARADKFYYENTYSPS